VGSGSPLVEVSTTALWPRFFGHCLAIAFLCLLADRAFSAAHTAPRETRFLRTVAALEAAPSEVRITFASLALTHLTLALGFEAETARAELSETANRPKLASWAQAVDRYSADLVKIEEDIRNGAELGLHVTEIGEVTLLAAGRMVLLGHPRREHQSTLEQEILRDFCARHSCDDLVDANGERSKSVAASATVRPSWTFNEDGLVCEHDTVSVTFPPGGRLPAQKRLCSKILQELAVLLDEVRWQMRQGVEVEWSGLEVVLTPARPEHRVQLNRAGDSVLMRAPLLAQFPFLLQQASDWLRERLVLENSSATLKLDARHYVADSVEEAGL